MKQRYNAFFDRVAPAASDGEFLERVLRKAENMENSKKKFNARPVMAAAAAVAALSVGVTAAATTGLIDFNKIFGGLISAEDETVGGNLVSEITDFRYEVSDPDYIIVPNGVTGTASNICVSFDIERADGQPVKDFMLRNGSGKELVTAMDLNLITDHTQSFGGGLDDYSVVVNDEGDLTVMLSVTYSIPVDQCAVRIMGSDLFDERELTLFREENNVWEHFVDADGQRIYFGQDVSALAYDTALYGDDGNERTDIDLSSISYFELYWGVEFVYTPNENAMQTLTAADISQTYMEPVTVWGESDMLDASEIECTVKNIEVSGTGGFIEYDRDPAYEALYNEDKICSEFDQYDILLLTDSGKEIRAEFELGTGAGNTQKFYFTYVGNRNERIAVDISTVTAISVNGVVYELA